MTRALKSLIFFWLTSFGLAIVGYFGLAMVMPDHYVFGTAYRMPLYHWDHPISFISIPCYFYGVIASVLAPTFVRLTRAKQVLLTVLIIMTTIAMSLPFGGMLWHYYDMKAGFFPNDWFAKMVRLGIKWGYLYGFQIIALSIPYSLICSIGTYFLTKKGSDLLMSEE